MHFKIIGAGNMERGVGHILVACGHDVTVVGRDPEELRAAGWRDRRGVRTRWGLHGVRERGEDPCLGHAIRKEHKP